MARNQTSPVQVDVSWDGAIATAAIRGELDITTAVGLERCLLALGAEHPERLILDLGDLAFIDVAGARALHEAYHLLRYECPVSFRKPRSSARKVFQMTGLLCE